MALRPQARTGLIIVAAVATFFGLKTVAQHFGVGILKSVTASRATLPQQEDAQVANVQAIAYPTTAKADVQATHATFDIWEWNAYFGLLYANGGVDTTKGSLMEKYNVNLTLHREDSNAQMKTDLVACAKQLHDGEKSCSTGAVAIVVMGDSAGQWFADLNPQLRKFGPEYQAEIIGAVGRSAGEDSVRGPCSWKGHPQSLKGSTIVGVIRDGDWNIALNYMGSNGLKNNPDLTTYDPDAVNWIAAPDEDYIKAVTDVYVPNRCEPRKVVKDGRVTGETKQVCPDAVVTWYPGDLQATQGRPGTCRIASSQEYASQMPAVIIGIKKFFNDNRDETTNLLAAVFQASDQIKAFDTARRKAGEISAAVYKDQNADYWFKAFAGYKDPGSGQPVGGSAVFNLEDNINFFGLDGKHNNNMRATYETFGRIATEQYPNLFNGEHAIPNYKDVVDTSFIRAAQDALSNGGVTGAAAESVDYAAAASGGNVVGHAAVYIPFATGSDQPLPEGILQIMRLKDELAVNSSLAIQLDGFTDNTGSDTVNIPLSQSRAAAVKRLLQKAAPASFPEERFKSVAGHGSQSPLCPGNVNAACKAQNRRVEITQIGN